MTAMTHCAHYSMMLLTERQTLLELLTNDCPSRSERRQRLVGGGWIDEIERGTSQTRQSVGQSLPPNIHTACVCKYMCTFVCESVRTSVGV